MIVFRLSRAAIVELTIVQVAPTCRTWGRLMVNGHTGVNRVRFRGRIRGSLLPAGTYRLRARAAGAARVTVVRLVIADRRPERLREALAATACAVGTDADAVARPAALSEYIGRGEPGDAARSNQGSARDATRNAEVQEGAVLGAQAIARSAQTGAADGLRLSLVLALALAAAMLALVALPGGAIPNARVASVVVDRRLELALAAGSLMVVGAAVYVLAA